MRRNKDMKSKKIIALLLTVTLFFCTFFVNNEVTSFASTSQYPVTTSISRNNTFGDVIRLRYFLNADSYVESIQGVITYEPAILSIRAGSFNAPTLSEGSLIYNTSVPGKIYFNAYKIPNSFDFRNDTLVMEIEFTVVAPVGATIRASIEELTDRNGNDIDPDTIQTRLEACPIETVTISPSTALIPGKTLTANVAYFGGSVVYPSVSYQWQRSSSLSSGWTNISGATAKTYTLTNDDINKYIRVIVTPNNTTVIGNPVTSNPVGLVKNVLSSATISGIAVVEQTLTANPQFTYTTSTNADSYQWQRSSDGTTWTAISGATSKTYTLTDNDINKYIRVVVTYNGTSKTSPSTEKVLQLGDVNKSGSVTISDATLIQKYLADLETLDEQQLKAADVNRDGVVNMSDVAQIQKFLAGIIDKF